MSLLTDLKAVCDRLAPLGWRDLLKEVSGGALDIAQTTEAALKKALLREAAAVNRGIPGFEDFNAAGRQGITPRQPSMSLLYHALASPNVTRDAGGAPLKGFPTLAEIETVENAVFGLVPVSLASLTAELGGDLSITVFATEYRPAPATATDVCADLAFARTGISRVGTARPKYQPEVRGFWPEDENNPNGFRVIPARFSAWLAAPVKGTDARVMRLRTPDATEKARRFWVPVHKLFDGPDCLAGLDLTLTPAARFFNMKLLKVQEFLKKSVPEKYPFVLTDELAELVEASEIGRIAVVPKVQTALVVPAKLDGKFVTYKMPKGNSDFATLEIPAERRDGFDPEIHPHPAYVHARTKVKDDQLFDLNDEPDVGAAVAKGGYQALMYVDFTGEGWVDIDVPQLRGRAGIAKATRPAYLLLSAPDFFPSAGQRELSAWANSGEIPASFRNRIWGVMPEPLSETRLPANLQLPDSPFEPKDDTVTAVVGMGAAAAPAFAGLASDVVRASILPDDAAGVFAPGWDVSVDVKGAVASGVAHLAAYGLGSPFPEDAKLCAALSTFWPAVAPDVYRTMPLHTGNPRLRGSVVPLTDEEIGQIGSTPWDGVQGPELVDNNGVTAVEVANFLHVDYVRNAVENRFSNRLIARVTSEEYQRRALAAARVHWVLGDGAPINKTRNGWLFLSFRAVLSGDPELIAAQTEAGRIFSEPVYRVEACFLGDGTGIMDSPKGPRFKRLPLKQRQALFVAAETKFTLRRRETDARWSAVAAE